MLSIGSLEAVLASNGIALLQKDVGTGGSATVHRAKVLSNKNPWGVEADTQLAIKEYRDEIVQKPEQIDRIRNEVSVGKLVRQRNVVGVYGLLELEGSAPLLLMEWVDGTGLDRWLVEMSRDWPQIAAIALGLVSALAALHKSQIFHRDIKPANVFVRPDDTPVLMDMGVVELANNSEATLHTSVKDFLGSVRYAAPQYLLGEKYDAADDVYSLGATLCLLVTGSEVFADVERKPLLPHHILTSAAKIGSLAGAIPAQISILIEGSLSRERARRPTLDEFSDVLRNPETAPYVQRELEARAREKRGFEVVEVSDDGATLFADLRGAMPSSTRYVVVREGETILVPSLNSGVKSEKWIADVELKHVRTGLGHFVVKGKRWIEGKPNQLVREMEALNLGTPGRWVEFDKIVDRVRAGDIVVVATVTE